jgi:glutamyl-tRNA synthetase
LEPADFAARITPFLAGAGLVADPPSAAEAGLIAAAAPLIQPRIGRLTEAVEMLGFLFVDEARFKSDPDAAAKALTPASAETLAAAEKALSGLEPWAHEEIERVLRGALITDLGLKPRVAFTPVYVAVTGRRVAPPLFDSIELLGRDRTMRRLAQALAVATTGA